MKETHMEKELLDGLNLRLEIVKTKRRPDWSNIDEFLSLMDEGLVELDDIVMLNKCIEPIAEMEMGRKTMMLLELHLQNPVKMSAEKVFKELLAEYRELKG